MSNKTPTSIIALPQGGGAQKGIGEKFSPDLFTGTGNFTVPIALPAGRSGFQPGLSLVYSTGTGNGPFGLGWSLSIPGISRKTSKGIPQYRDSAKLLTARDTFILSGAEDLVPVNGAPEGATRYRPRTEGLFARIDHHHNSGNNYWKVRSKDGLVSFYGTPVSNDAPTPQQDPAVVADPNNRSKIFAWKLSRTEDPFGNQIVYAYARDMEEDGPHHWDQLYLSQIKYVDFAAENRPTGYLVSVIFHYENRPDPFSDYRAGFEIRTRQRCTRIEVRTHADEERLVRTYHLIYLDQRPGLKNGLPLNGVSLLSQIKVVGHDGNHTEDLPPLEFGYSQFEPAKRKFFPLQGKSLPAQSLSSPDTELVDLFGNGLPDILQMNGAVRYWRNLGNGQYDLPREMKEAPSGLQLADSGVQMLDADGDGRADLLVTKPELSGYFPLRFGGLWDRRSFQRYETAPSFNLEDSEVKLLDLNGDGVTDALRSGSQFECFFNHPKAGWNSTRQVQRKGLEVFPNINFSDPHVKLGDMTGDGLQDIILVYDGNIEYWPNLGHGNWGKQIRMRNSSRFRYGYDPRRILIGDVDGDGLADLVYVDDTKVTLWINQSGNRWGDPIEITGTPSVSDIDAVRLADMLGTGISGVLWSRDITASGRESMFFLDFTGGIKPYLLNEMDNHIGAVTHVEYAPSTRFYLEDQKHPQTRWKTPLPFPVQVVAKVEVIDEISKGKLTTEYRYHHGYWDGAEPEFRGFGRVDQRDTEVFADFHATGLHPDRLFTAVENKMFSSPVETRTWFHQGPIGDEFGGWEETNFSKEFWPSDSQVLLQPQALHEFLNSLSRRAKRDALRTFRGRILRSELYALDGTERQNWPYTVIEYLYGLREESRPEPTENERQRIFFPHALAQRTTQWERSDEPMTQFTFTSDYDQYGQPRSQINIAVPRRRKFLEAFSAGSPAPEPYLATRTFTDYAQRDDADRYIVDRVARTTTYEIVNDGRDDLFSLQRKIESNILATPPLIIGQMLNFYDRDNSQPNNGAFLGLPFQKLGDYGALVRTESLVLTEALLQKAYGNDSSPFFQHTVPPNWTAEYPREFQTLLPALAGYIYHEGGEYATGYFAATERRRYDFHDNPSGKGRGLVMVKRDPLGHDTAIAYDRFDLLPEKVTDAAGLTTQAANDYRVLQPREVTEPNSNATSLSFTPLGLLQSTLVKGKHGEGDQQHPGMMLAYDFLAYAKRKEPISVRTIRRMYHDSEIDIPLPQRDETITTIEYSDGYGRLLQTRTQAEDVVFGDLIFGNQVLPANQSNAGDDAVGHPITDSTKPRVVVSGWQIYDNKGRVVEKYEPFFSEGWEYAQPADKQLGQKATMFYDPRGRVIRTLNPDKSEQLVIYGVPTDLIKPDQFAPTPWEAYTYDANDNAGRTHSGDPIAKQYDHHWNTPSNTVVDALGRIVETVERHRKKMADGSLPAIEELSTKSTYDVRGNLLTVTDALGRTAFQHVYDLTNHALRIESIDAGIRQNALDAAGNVVEQRDSKGALILHAYDELNRPIRKWARDDGNSAVTLRERLIYGDSADAGLNRSQAATKNLLGRLFQHYDEAGLLAIEAYDFKGNVVERVRRVISDAAILSVFEQGASTNWQIKAYRIDWQLVNTSELLDTAEYRTSITYDALNRIKTMRYPQDVDSTRQELRPHYNHAGALERVELDGKIYVERIAYNAKGQRTLIAYGNGVMTRYAYDTLTFRLVRLRTERYTKPSPLTYHPSGALLQDFAYEYDLTGNMLALHDRSPASGLPSQPDRLDRAFSYDPLYRLITATGRECDVPPPQSPWDDAPKCQDVNRTRAYTEEYSYNAVGNMTRLRHQGGTSGFTRDLTLAPNSNRLATVNIGTAVYNYAYDDNGNLIREAVSRHFEWDHSDRMRVYRTQAADGTEPSVYAHYLYDVSGQRVKKLIRKQGGQYEGTVYVDGIFEHHYLVQGGITQQNNTLHVMDNEKRIALLRAGRPFTGDTTPAIKYHLGDHLGSSNVVVDDTGNWVDREEYTPYGESSFGSFAHKRYRFTAKEHDEESGLYYHGARYYAPWLGKWVSPDSASKTRKSNLFIYANNNPIYWIDLSGNEGIPWYERAINVVAESFGWLLGASPVNAPTGPDAPVYSRVSDIEYTARLALVGASGGLGSVAESSILKTTGSHIAARTAFGATYGASLGGGARMIEDISYGKISSSEAYFKSILYGGAAGATVELSLGFLGKTALSKITSLELARTIPNEPGAFLERGMFGMTEGKAYIVRAGERGLFGTNFFKSQAEATAYAKQMASMGEEAIRQVWSLPRIYSKGGLGNPVDTIRVFEVPPKTPFITGVVGELKGGEAVPVNYLGGGPQVVLSGAVKEQLKEVYSIPVSR